MAFTITSVNEAKEYKILISQTAGEIPSLIQLDKYILGFNAVDNLWYEKDYTVSPVVIKQINTNLAALITALSVSVAGSLSVINATQKVITVKKIIGAPNEAGCDYNFVAGSGHAAQPIELRSIIPAFAQVLNVMAKTDETFSAATTFGVTCGNVSGGTQYWTSAAMITKDAIGTVAVGSALPIVPVTTVSSVWIGGTPDAGTTWTAITAGKISVYVTYIDITGL